MFYSNDLQICVGSLFNFFYPCFWFLSLWYGKLSPYYGRSNSFFKISFVSSKTGLLLAGEFTYIFSQWTKMRLGFWISLILIGRGKPAQGLLNELTVCSQRKVITYEEIYVCTNGIGLKCEFECVEHGGWEHRWWAQWAVVAPATTFSCSGSLEFIA